MTTPLHVGISTDYAVPEGQLGRHVITEEYPRGYVVIGQFKNLIDAKRYLKNMSKHMEASS